MFNSHAVTECNSIGSASVVARAERFLVDREWRLEAKISVTPFPEWATLGLMTFGADLFAADAAFVIFIGPGG